MNKVKEVEVRACQDAKDDEGVQWVAEVDAHYFSVYSGEPGDFIWDADFCDKNAAIDFAVARAISSAAVFVNRIGEL